MLGLSNIIPRSDGDMITIRAGIGNPTFRQYLNDNGEILERNNENEDWKKSNLVNDIIDFQKKMIK